MYEDDFFVNNSESAHKMVNHTETSNCLSLCNHFVPLLNK